MTVTNQRVLTAAGLNWKSMLQERLPFSGTQERSTPFPVVSYDTLLIAARMNVDPSGGAASWGSGVLALEFDPFGDGQTWLPAPGAADTVRVQGGSASAIAATSVVTLTADGAVLRVDCRGMRAVSLRPTTAAGGGAGDLLDVAIIAFSGEMPPLTYDLTHTAVRAGAETP